MNVIFVVVCAVFVPTKVNINIPTNLVPECLFM